MQSIPKVLIISPGGIRGLKSLGFLCPLEDKKLLDDITTYCGVSTGAFISLLLICGYKIREIIREYIIFKELEDISLDHDHCGKEFMSIDPIRKRLTQLVIKKLGIVPSLNSLFMMTGKNLVTITLDMATNNCDYLTPINNPNMLCVDAVLFSMNVAYKYYQLVYKEKKYADGALTNPYPIEYFDDGETDILGIYTSDNNSKIANILSNQRYFDIISRSSPKCKHVYLETKIDYSNINMEDKVKLLVEGYNKGYEYVV